MSEPAPLATESVLHISSAAHHQQHHPHRRHQHHIHPLHQQQTQSSQPGSISMRPSRHVHPFPFHADDNPAQARLANKSRKKRGRVEETPAEREALRVRVNQMYKKMKYEQSHMSEQEILAMYHQLACAPGSLPIPTPSFFTLLHHQSQRFVSSVSITDEERAEKQQIIDRLSSSVKEFWGQTAQVQPFGSFVTGLSLPHSDVDCVCLLPSSTKQSIAGDLRDIQTILTVRAHQKSTLSPTFQLIGRARVPILKYTDHDLGVKADICINQEDGLRAVPLMSQYLTYLPTLRPLVLICKQMLQQLQLSEVFKGGINSYILQLMIIFFLQMYQLAAPTPTQTQTETQTHADSETESGTETDREAQAAGLQDNGDSTAALPSVADHENIAMLLFSFFDFYGNRFDYYHYGIRIGLPITSIDKISDGDSSQISFSPPTYFSKVERNWVDLDRPYLLSIENPLDASHDVGAGCFAIQRIKHCFALAHERVCLMAMEWTATGTITIMQQQQNQTTNNSSNGIEAAGTATIATTEEDSASEKDKENRKEEKEKKKKKKKEKNDKHKNKEKDTESSAVAPAVDGDATEDPDTPSTSHLHVHTRQDAQRMHIEPMLAALFTRSLYVTAALVKTEQQKDEKREEKKHTRKQRKQEKMKKRAKLEEAAALMAARVKGTESATHSTASATRQEQEANRMKKLAKRQAKEQAKAEAEAVGANPANGVGPEGSQKRKKKKTKKNKKGDKAEKRARKEEKRKRKAAAALQAVESTASVREEVPLQDEAEKPRKKRKKEKREGEGNA